MARMVISPPQGQPMLPDHPNWSWHEYGMRVGFWRLRKVLQELGVSPTVTLNARVCETYPQVVQACVDSGWELNAHGYDQVPMHKAEDQRRDHEIDGHDREIFRQAPARLVRPGLTQTFDTLDYLSEAGIEYIGDWVLDDEPVTLKTTHKPVVALPYNFEIHDIVMMALQHHPSDVWHTRALDHFNTLYAESAERPKIMAIACHPYLSGVPHRIGHVQRTFAEILGHDGVVAWDGAKILDWYLAAAKANDEQNSPLPARSSPHYIKALIAAHRPGRCGASPPWSRTCTPSPANAWLRHSEWLATHEPARATARRCRKILDAGATITGKTICDEFFYSVTGINPHCGMPVRTRAGPRPAVRRLVPKRALLAPALISLAAIPADRSHPRFLQRYGGLRPNPWARRHSGVATWRRARRAGLVRCNAWRILQSRRGALDNRRVTASSIASWCWKMPSSRPRSRRRICYVHS